MRTLTSTTLLIVSCLGATGTASAQSFPASYTYAGVPFDKSVLPLAAGEQEFPFITLPDGYRYINDRQPRDLDRFPFWTPKEFRFKEGRLSVA